MSISYHILIIQWLLDNIDDDDDDAYNGDIDNDIKWLL